MRLVDRLSAETASFHPDADEDIRDLLGATASAADYRRFLVRTYGFTCPVERAIASVPSIERYLDPRRLRKHELLRRDLASFQMTTEQINRIAQCPVPLVDTPQEALGWAYPIERAALRHTQLFHHLAAIMPGEVAFTSSYLKCYFGSVGEAWKSFGRALDEFGDRPQHARRVVEAARAAFRYYRSWRLLADELSPAGKQPAASPQPMAVQQLPATQPPPAARPPQLVPQPQPPLAARAQPQTASQSPARLHQPTGPQQPVVQQHAARQHPQSAQQQQQQQAGPEQPAGQSQAGESSRRAS
jgi:heme oxygenase